MALDNGRHEPFYRDPTWAGWCAAIASFVYLALFLPSFYVGILCPGLYENANITATIGILIVFLSIVPPVAIVVSIGMMWFMYFQGAWRNVFLFALLPLVLSFIVVLIFMAMRLFIL